MLTIHKYLLCCKQIENQSFTKINQIIQSPDTLLYPYHSVIACDDNKEKCN